jgi:hypothetical protein
VIWFLQNRNIFSKGAGHGEIRRRSDFYLSGKSVAFLHHTAFGFIGPSLHWGPDTDAREGSKENGHD